MLKTKMPYAQVDFDRYFGEYMQQEDAIRSIPTTAELKELARQGLVKDHMVLQPLPAGTPAEIGDTVTFRTESELPKFNKEKVTVSIGRGLYNKELELLAAGKREGESYDLTIDTLPVHVTVLGIKRKQEPAEVTDEMAAELRVKTNDGTPITTVAEYEAYIAEENVAEKLATVNYYVMEKLLPDYPIPEYDEDDLRILGELEAAAFRTLYKEHDGIDVDTLTEEQAHEMWGPECGSFADFIGLRYEWYKMKVQQCLLYRSILGLENDPKYDYTDHYEVLSELQLLMFEKIRTMLRQ